MNTPYQNSRSQSLPRLLEQGVMAFLFLLFVVSMMGCQKRCQPPVEKPFDTLSGTQWRLVETTSGESQFNNLDRFSFFIMNFAVDFSGNMQKVEFNTLYETPVGFFQWNPENGDLLHIRTKSVTVQGEGEEAVPGTSQRTESYSYDLGRELTMTKIPSGEWFRYVPYNGVVNPDSNCSF